MTEFGELFANLSFNQSLQLTICICRPLYNNNSNRCSVWSSRQRSGYYHIQQDNKCARVHVSRDHTLYHHSHLVEDTISRSFGWPAVQQDFQPYRLIDYRVRRDLLPHAPH